MTKIITSEDPDFELDPESLTDSTDISENIKTKWEQHKFKRQTEHQASSDSIFYFKLLELKYQLPKNSDIAQLR